jgi:hypothetical protein
VASSSGRGRDFDDGELAAAAAGHRPGALDGARARGDLALSVSTGFARSNKVAEQRVLAAVVGVKL